MPDSGPVSLKIYTILGQFVRTLIEGEKQAGFYRVIWDGRNHAGLRVESGVYFVQMEAGDDFVEVRKVVLVR